MDNSNVEEEMKQPLVTQTETRKVPSPFQSNESLPNPYNRLESHATVNPNTKNEFTSVQPPRHSYNAPKVHRYAIPQYKTNDINDGNTHGQSWGTTNDEEQFHQVGNGSTIDIVFSGMYTLAAAFTIIQGFGMLIEFTPAAVTLGAYTMAFGALVIFYDLKSDINGVNVEQYFPFLGNYIGRSLTILFFAVLCGQTHEYAGWTKIIVLYNILVATLQGFVYFTTKTITAQEAPMEDLPDDM